MSVRLIHWSAEPLAAIDPAWDYSGGRTRLDKPTGFWVSVEGNGDGWADWCRDEQFGVERLAHEHEVTLAPDARILRITTPEGIDALTKQYGTGRYGGHEIDWPRVAQEYQGILISPYQWSRRLAEGCSWYYSWDCASGCIWDLNAIAAIRPLAVAEAAR
jgi:hypothetical protein